MTLPAERARAIVQTRQFLLDLLYKYKRVPKEVKTDARACLRHFPSYIDVEGLANKCPDILGDFNGKSNTPRKQRS